MKSNDNKILKSRKRAGGVNKVVAPKLVGNTVGGGAGPHEKDTAKSELTPLILFSWVERISL